MTTHRLLFGALSLLMLSQRSHASDPLASAADYHVADCRSSPNGDLVEINVTDIPVSRVLEELIRLKHLQVQHAERIGNVEMSLHFTQCVPLQSLLNVIASNSGLQARRDGNGGYSIEPQRHADGGDLSTFDSTQSEIEALKQESAKRDYEASVMLQTGNGMPRDDAKAMQLLRRAADLGNPDAQCALGLMLANGTHIQKDRVQAYAYLHRANALEGPCHGKFSELETQMTAEELRHAKAAQG
jgi:hypothetical protein